MSIKLKLGIFSLLMIFVLTLSGCNTAHYDMGVSESYLSVEAVEADNPNQELRIARSNQRILTVSFEELFEDVPERDIVVQLNQDSGYIEWRYIDEAEWFDLVLIETYEAESSGFGWVQWIVNRIADLIFYVSVLSGGHYVVGLVVITVLIRVLGWPIYAKSNSTQMALQMAQPELEKVKEKYQGKTDQKSQQMMTQENMRIWKEYGVKPFGCLLPFLQMPIFIAMYQTVRRIPLTPRYVEELNFNFLWFNFRDEPVSPFYSPENFTFILLALIVGLTMFLFQQYAMRKPEILQNKKYRTPQQIQSEKTMKYMSYFMVFMLVFIAFTNLGIAFYWIIGNLLQFLQTRQGRKQMIKKLEERKKTV